MKFRDKYPRKCNQLCPKCKEPCMHGIEKHFNADDCLTAHICGSGHWWIQVCGPDNVNVLVSGFVERKP